MCGVEDWHSIIEFLMMGATAVEMGSAIMLRGYAHITETLRKLEDWLREKGYSSLDELRGNALASLTAFEELPERLLRVKMAAPCDGTCPDGCRARCVGACLYDAISQGTEGIAVDAAACSGCGLCVSLCPKVNSSRRAAALRLLFDMNVTMNKCYIKMLSIPLKYWRKRKKLLKS